MQIQSELREFLAKVSKEPLCIVGTLEAKHEVVSVSQDDDLTERTPNSPNGASHSKPDGSPAQGCGRYINQAQSFSQ